MKVMKFGGSSVGTPENIRRVRAIVEKESAQKIVVVSAFSGVTDQLIELCRLAAAGDKKYKEVYAVLEKRHLSAADELLSAVRKEQARAHILSELTELRQYLDSIAFLGEITPKLRDYILSAGERLCAYIVSQALSADLYDSRQFIRTDSGFGHAQVDFVATNILCRKVLPRLGQLSVFPGFIAANDKNQTTTLGRGGGDYTAAILAAGFEVESVEIWTDVDGFLTSDPRKVTKAFPIHHLSYSEVFELSNFGAKVIYPPTIHPLLSAQIPIIIKNTFHPEAAGTHVDTVADALSGGAQTIKGISSIDDVALLTLQGVGMAGTLGISRRLFGALEQAAISIILISQASSEQSITFAILPTFVSHAKTAIQEEFSNEIDQGTIGLKVEEDLSVIAVVGENMRNMPGIAGQLYSALGRNGVNVIAIAQGSSELNISTVVAKDQLTKALNVVHEAFFLIGYKKINLYLAGIGTVGGKLLDQIRKQQADLLEHHGLKLVVAGIMNSKKMLLKEEGIDLSDLLHQLETEGQALNFDDFIQQVRAANLRNSIFVDCTASPQVAKIYAPLLTNFVSVVAANKIAASGKYAHYLDLKEIAQKRGVKFLYETNVGAGLPIVRTIEELLLSGDEVTKIEAVLSGTLNFIFNTLSATVPMSQAIQMAKDAGFSEPDPRIDLSGIDVQRKLLILAREAGLSLEAEDIAVKKFLPESCFDTATVEAFFDAVKKLDADFEVKRQALAEKKKTWRFVARLEENKASIGLEEVAVNHPFYSLKGSDNIVTLYTKRYHDQPMIIKGAGAGAAVTAAGVFGDIIRVANL